MDIPVEKHFFPVLPFALASGQCRELRHRKAVEADKLREGESRARFNLRCKVINPVRHNAIFTQKYIKKLDYE
jgi:hypothetical protein